jgi:hypothetical protein
MPSGSLSRSTKAPYSRTGAIPLDHPDALTELWKSGSGSVGTDRFAAQKSARLERSRLHMVHVLVVLIRSPIRMPAASLRAWPGNWPVICSEGLREGSKTSAVRGGML